MASSKLVQVLILFSVTALVVVSAAAQTCEPGRAFPHDPLPGCRAFPHDPLPGCRAYVLRRCAGDDPPGVRVRCCQQLREVTPPCRCEALRVMVDVLVEEEAAPPSCQKAAMADIAGALPSQAECDLEAPPAPLGGECPLDAAE